MMKAPAESGALKRLAPRWLVVIGLMTAGACGSDTETTNGKPPTEPDPPPQITKASLVGSYEATQLVVQRPNSARDLIGEPDTRINLHLNANGVTAGQLKIGTDPEFRTKVPLDGLWRLSVPDRVIFDFDRANFLEEIAFHVQKSVLSGDWVGNDVRIHVTLQKVD